MKSKLKEIEIKNEVHNCRNKAKLMLRTFDQVLQGISLKEFRI
jgi:hypothetical protein